MAKAFDARARTVAPQGAERFSVRSIPRKTWEGVRRPGTVDWGVVVIETGVVETKRRGFGLLPKKLVEGTRLTGIIGGDAAKILETVRETGALPKDARVAGTVFVANNASATKQHGAYYEVAGKVIDRSR